LHAKSSTADYNVPLDCTAPNASRIRYLLRTMTDSRDKTYNKFKQAKTRLDIK
jgi:hypothetical protein